MPFTRIKILLCFYKIYILPFYVYHCMTHRNMSISEKDHIILKDFLIEEIME